MAEKTTRPAIQVIDRMKNLLAALAAHSAPVNLKRLAEETGLHPSTAHRILNVMVGKRMVDRVEPGAYRLGVRLLELGALVRARLNLRDEALPFMRELQSEIGGTVSLWSRQRDEVVCVERIAPESQPLRAAHTAGTRMPLHATAAGKLFLAADGPDKWLEYAQRTGLPKVTAATLTESAALQLAIDSASQHGCAFDHEEAEKGVCCVSAGICDVDGRLVAALSASAPTDRFDKAWAATVRQTAMRISRAVGCAAPD